MGELDTAARLRRASLVRLSPQSPAARFLPENHPLSLGGRQRGAEPVHHFVEKANLIIGLVVRSRETNFGIKFPKGKEVSTTPHSPRPLNKDVVSSTGLSGRRRLTLDALIGELKQTINPIATQRSGKGITGVRAEWMAQWEPLLRSNRHRQPISRIYELMNGTDPKNTIITHDCRSPRDQNLPVLVSTEPMSYIGWGKTTQLGIGPRVWPWARSWRT